MTEIMPEYFRSTAKKPGATKVRKGYKSGGGDWIQGAIKRPGAFTKKAKDAGMSVSKYANKVLKKGRDASTRTKKQANLAKTLRIFPPQSNKPSNAFPSNIRTPFNLGIHFMKLSTNQPKTILTKKFLSIPKNPTLGTPTFIPLGLVSLSSFFSKFFSL